MFALADANADVNADYSTGTIPFANGDAEFCMSGIALQEQM